MFRTFARSLATAATPKLQDVAVVGGGPAGLSVIAALKANEKTRHLKCTLIEGNSLEVVRKFAQQPPQDPHIRNIALTSVTREFMQNKIGSWEHIKQDRIKPFQTLVCYDSYDNNARARIPYDGAMCEIVNIQSLLLTRIQALDKSSDAYPTTVIDNTKVKSIETPGKESILDWPVITLENGEQIQARLIVGADGHNSPVRHFANIESKGHLYDRFGVVAVVKMLQDDPRSIAWQRFLTTDAFTVLPLPNGHVSIVWGCPPELSDIIMKTDERIMPHLINAGMVLEESQLNHIYGLLKADPQDMLVIDEIKRQISLIDPQELKEKFPVPAVLIVEGTRAKFPLKMAHAQTYTAPRVALVADAAHSVHPLAGQGFNMGEADVEALVRAIEQGVENKMDIGSPLVLANYSAERWPKNQAMAHVCDKIHKVFTSDNYPLVVVRGIGMKALNLVDSAKQMFKPSGLRTNDA